MDLKCTLLSVGEESTASLHDESISNLTLHHRATNDWVAL